MDGRSPRTQKQNELVDRSKVATPPLRRGTDDGMKDVDELMESLRVTSESLKLKFLPQPANSSTGGSAQPLGAGGSNSQQQRLRLQGMMAATLDDLVFVYSSLMTGSAEDRLMKPELDSMRSYLKRVIKRSEEDRRRNQVSQPSTRRFILNGIGGSSRSSNDRPEASTKHSTIDHHNLSNRNTQSSVPPKKIKLTESEIEDRIEAHRNLPLDQRIILPEIRQVIKNPQANPHQNPHDEDDDSDDDDDDELKVYDD